MEIKYVTLPEQYVDIKYFIYKGTKYINNNYIQDGKVKLIKL